MRSFILLSFLFLGLGFYELSGGSDFEPEVRPSAAAAVVETTRLDTQDIVSRDDPDTVAGLESLPAAVTQPLIDVSANTATVTTVAVNTVAADPVTEAAEQAVAEAIAAALAAPAPQTAVAEEQPVLVSLASPLADRRFVDATSLNVRAGPSTNDRVVTKLDQNEPVIVLSELDDGWALVRIGDAGTEGWVAARFLTQ